ncbi:hypothetical protein [Streptomyces odontomachi]|uniref:hypothetical protein n=1 Tax=Streptomyces odontomachi TaxID=2944940 RepID=UPI00210EDCC9|nr:hypothetical protein [Streptomyces sp. ODS25]
MSDARITVGAFVTVTDGPFATLRTTITEVDATLSKAKGAIEMFGHRIPVDISFAGPPGEPRVTAVPDRSDVIAAHAGAIRRYGVVGRVVSGDGAGRWVRVDKVADTGGSAGVMIRIADDPGLRVNCVNEWVEDWAGVEESFLRDGRRVDWG